MLRNEEIVFNQKKQQFEDTLKTAKEAAQAYDDAWMSWDDTRFGITAEQYEALEELIKNIEKDLPARDTIIALPSVAKSRSIFSRLMSYLKAMLKLNQEQASPEQTNEQEDAQVTTERKDTQRTRDVSEKIYDAEELMQQCIRARDELLKASQMLDDVYERHLDEPPTGRVIKTERDGPGILDDYRQSSWGIERICLDGFQNHLPADSKGTRCYLHFLVDNKWVDCETAKQHRDRIKKVRFADNGVGFTADNLFYLHSTKTSEDISAGQFGEGMKLASIAAVNLGLGLEFQSRNWRALAGSEEKILTNTRNADQEEIRKRLVYDVTTYSGEPINGSRTIFHTPIPEFIDYALQLPEKVLELGKKELEYTSKYGDIIDTEKGGEAFVKEIYLTTIKSFFSYNFRDADVNPDRNGFHNFSPKNNICQMIAELEDIEIIKKLIRQVYQYSEQEGLHEKKSLSFWSDLYPEELGATENLNSKLRWASESRIKEMSDLWKRAFEEVFGTDELGKDGMPKKIILKTDYEIPEYVKETLDDYVLIRLPENWVETLRKLGVQADKDIVPEYIEEKIKTSLTLDYGNQIWDEQRIMLDACQNHLPTDSNGTAIFLRFQTKDGTWHDYREFEKFEDSEIVKIKIADDGIGYDYKNLGLFASVKTHEESTGKWGEGLKMLSAAALRNGVQMELRSRDWISVPETQTEILNEGQPNEKKIERVVFTIRKKVDKGSKILDDGDNPTQLDYGYTKDKEKSSTTFVNPTPELIKQFRNVRNNVLAFNPRTPIATANNADILDTFSGQLYVRNILIPGNHQLKYSYHLKDFDIETRDRDVIKRESMQKMLRMILENVDDERFIGEFLSNAVSQAQEYSEERFLEFETPFIIGNDTELADKWISVFKKKFGERTAIRRSGDLDMDAYHQAQHMGLDMVTLPDDIARALTGLRGKSGQTIASYREALDAAIKNAIPIKEEDLTEGERTVLEHLYKYNAILNLDSTNPNPIKKINIYDYPQDYLGDRAAGFAGYGDEINISRQTLNSNIINIGDVFFHESGHALTGAKDASPAFRDYLSRLLGCIAARMLPLEQSVEDNGVAQDVSLSDIGNILTQLGKILQAESKQYSNGEELGDK